MQETLRYSGMGALRKQGSALPNEATIIRRMIFLSAMTDICVATYLRGEDTIYVDSHHPLPFKELKRIRNAIRQKMEDSGWEAPAEQSLSLCINGVLSRYIRHPRQKHTLKSATTFEVRLPMKRSLFLFIAGVDGELDDEFLMELRVLSSTPEVGYRVLLTHVLQHAEDYHLILADMLDGIILCDDKGRIRFMNERARRMCGFEQLPHRGSLLHPTPLCDLQKILFEAINDGITQLNRVIPLGNSNTQLIGVNVRYVQNLLGQPVGWLMILRDITASWQSDQIRSMISIASHELNTPLASMKNTVDLLLDGEVGPLSPTQQKFLKIIRDDMGRLQRLLTDMLDLSRLEDSKLELDRRRNVRIEFIINKVIESYKIFAKSRGITLKARIPAELSSIRSDRDRITQVLVNLVDNAIKYSDFGSEVVIAAEETDDEIVVSVSDQGAGISEEDLNKIFEKFVQLNNLPEGVHRGFGLGLSIAREIVESHGGRLWASSTPGEGSTFYFSLPKNLKEEKK